ncbi:DUF4013 domain-containing protein [Halorubellus sp. PRR65]|uniref:DUF4013 domain-containing protein n=1 Tax=Halorubellus sp. PRR65 TaxID=3098148 RepID=UPI002B261B2F|nr:DUF4013 domain-containing protein [Halorubellus sp. PRR65]
MTADSDTFVGALRYPTRGAAARDGVATLTVMALAVALAGRYAVTVYPAVAALGFLALAGAAVVAWLGYLGRVLAGTVGGDLASGDGALVRVPGDASDLPAAGGVRALLATGARVAAASVPYLGAPFALLYVTVLGLGGLAPDSVQGGGGLALLAGGTLSFLLALAFVYVYPAALCELAATGSLKRALAPWAFRDVLAHAAYLYAWTAAFAIAVLALGAYARVLTASGVFGLLAALGAGYASAVAARLAGMGYRRARRR